MFKYLTKWWTVLITIGLFATLQVSNPDIVQSFKYSYYDFLQEQKEVVHSSDIILVNIDEKAIAKEGQYPWPRDIVAKYIDETPPDALSVLNIIYSEPDRFGQDNRLAEALSQKAVVLSSAPTQQTSDGVGAFVGVATFGEQNENWLYEFPGLLYPIESLANWVFGVGATVAVPDEPTGVVRRAPLVVKAAGHPYPSLALDTLRVYSGEPSYQMKVGTNGVEWIRMGRQDPITTNSFAETPIAFWNKFDSISITDLSERTEDGHNPWSGKILLFGITAEGYANPVPTPTGAKYPHEVQAHLVQTVLSGYEIQIPDWLAIAELGLLLISALGILLAVYIFPTIPAVIVSLLLIGGPVYASFGLWSAQTFYFDVVMSSLASLVVFAQSSFNKYYITFLEKRQIEKQFAGYASPTVVRLLQENPSLIKDGMKREISICFSDLRGFTPLGESFGDDVKGLTKLMNGYMDAITEPVLHADGMIIKYIGDASMHIHNAPIEDEQHPKSAVQTGINMLRAVEKFNEQITAEGRPPIGMGAGINTGLGYLGEMGSTARHSYDVLGDSVSTAARIESKCKEYGCLLLVGEETVKRCSPNDFFFLKVDDLAVKGKTVGIGIYTVLDLDKNKYIKPAEMHEAMHSNYQKQNFDKAIKICNDLMDCFEGQMQSYYKMWIERCEYMKTQDLPKDWNGVFIATTK
jgi:adenylate cyclase